jgi:hypothetical protein
MNAGQQRGGRGGKRKTAGRKGEQDIKEVLIINKQE